MNENEQLEKILKMVHGLIYHNIIYHNSAQDHGSFFEYHNNPSTGGTQGREFCIILRGGPQGIMEAG